MDQIFTVTVSSLRGFGGYDIFSFEVVIKVLVETSIAV